MLQRLHYIDRLKGLAILLVIMGHYECYVLDKFGVLFEIIGSCHMPFFMFLSGYVLNRNYTIEETARNTLKLLVPFFFISVLYSYCIGSNIYGMMSSPYKYGYWYLYVLAIYRVILYICQLSSNIVVRKKEAKIRLRLEVFFLFLFLCAFHILNSNIKQPYNDLFSVWMVRQYFLFFFLGYISRRYNILSRLSKQDYVYSICLVLFVFVCYLYICGYGHLFYVCGPLLVGWLSYIFIHRENKSSKVEDMMELFGQNSFDIYVYHYFILLTINLSTLGQWFDITGNIFLEASLGLVLSVLIAFFTIFIGKLVRQSNMLRRLLFI